MGGHQSHKQGNRDFGRIFIRTDKPFYFAGEIVTGNIYLQVQKEGFPGIKVFIRVSGKEKCKWEVSRSDTDSNGNSTTTTDTYRGKNTIYCHKILIHQFQNHTLPIGQYSFPFQFHLMSHLPGSFYEKNSIQNYEALLKYRVKAEIESFNKNFENIKDQQEVTLREPLTKDIHAIGGQMRASGATCCCIDQGTCYISAVFDKNTYLPGETAFLLIDIDNSHCALDVVRIEVTLKNYITLSNGSIEKVFPKIVNRREIRGLRAGQKAMEDDRIYMQVVLVDQDPSQGPIKPSSNGKLVKSVYELSATAILDQCTCCETNPEVKVPITILAPVQMDQNALPPQPPNWDPQVFDSQLIYLNNQDLYVKSQNKGMDQQMAKPYM